MRRICIDTETTGFGNARIIEVACVEFHPRTGKTVDVYHAYINPEDIPVHFGAYKIHGLSNRFLRDKPIFSEIYPGLKEFIKGAELIAHNAPFDTRMMNLELARLGEPSLLQIASAVNCSLAVARRVLRHLPKHKVDDLCDHYGIDRSHRAMHGALTDCELLVQILLHLEKEPGFSISHC